jgi:hypothetical protein
MPGDDTEGVVMSSVRGPAQHPLRHLDAEQLRALSPRIAAFSLSLSVLVPMMCSTGCCDHGIGGSVPIITWLAPTCATRWRRPSAVNTSESKYSWLRYSVGFFSSP